MVTSYSIFPSNKDTLPVYSPDQQTGIWIENNAETPTL